MHFKILRSKLRDFIEKYENSTWKDTEKIDNDKLIESDKSEYIAELERLFIENRKNIIRKKIKKFGLTQANLAELLGHKSTTYMSELMNGISPFTLKDLIFINRLLKIELSFLIPVFLSIEDEIKIKATVKKLKKSNFKLTSNDLASN